MYGFFFFQKLLLVQNPEPYLTQKKHSRWAIVMKKATLSWSIPDTQPDAPTGPDGHNKEHEMTNGTSKKGDADNLVTLRNISFTLPKVCGSSDKNKRGYLCSAEGLLNNCV